MRGKRLIVAIVSIIIVLVVLITGCYFYFFYGAIKDIQKTLPQSLTDYERVNKNLKKLIIFVEGIPQVKNGLTKVITDKYGSNKTSQRSKQLKHHIRSGIWRILLDIKFSDDELIYLWCSYAPYINGHGLNNASIYQFGKDLKELSTREIIALIVNTRAPLSYQRNPSKLELKVNILLDRWNKKQNDLKPGRVHSMRTTAGGTCCGSNKKS